jgi:hypothetical protein
MLRPCSQTKHTVAAKDTMHHHVLLQGHSSSTLCSASAVGAGLPAVIFLLLLRERHVTLCTC